MLLFIKKYAFSNLFRGEFAKILIKYATSQITGNVLRMIAGFLTVRLIAPDIYGYFNGKGIFLGYLTLAHLGIMNGLNRELPVEQGKKNIARVHALASVGYWVALFISIPAATILCSMAAYSLYYTQLDDALLYITYGISAFFLLFNKFYLPILYRTNQDFIKLTKITIYISVINILSVILVWISSDIKGLCIRLTLLNVTEFLFLYILRPVKVMPQWSTFDIKHLFKIGIPIYVVGHITPLWDTIKNNIIFGLGGSLQYGYYALTGVVHGAIGTIPSAFSQIIYPKMAIAYGKGESLKNVIKLSYKPTILLFAISCLIAAIGYWVLPFAVDLFLPKYTPGIKAATWALFIPIVSSFSLINNYFNVYKRQKMYVIGILSGIVASLIYIYSYYYLWGFDIVLFPQSLLVGMLIQNIICIVLINLDVKRNASTSN